MNPDSPMTSPATKSDLLLNRRQAVWRLAVLMGGAMVGSQVFLRGETLPPKDLPAFTDADRALLDQVADTIIPRTDIPGAADVGGMGAFMTMMVNDCYNPKQHAEFSSGLVQLQAACKEKYGAAFGACTPAQRTDFLNALDAEQKAHNAKKGKDDDAHYFRAMKELACLGYFSSEIGCTQAVRYIEVPGAYHGDVPYKKGDPAWY